MHYKFDEDLRIAKNTEIELAKRLEEEKGVEVISICNTQDYDILIRNKHGKYAKLELKEDFMAKNTGNIAIEFESRGLPSGISVSKATHWVYKIVDYKNEWFIIESKKIKRMIGYEMYHRIVSGGDPNSNTKMYLFSIEEFEKCSDVLFKDSKYV
ncbi:hypothetical protein E2P63_03890 [Candidatus Bathyarchaeota archaeon]|nr:hypothetical protein E2P63_03890 [Candidatus Bathyarchaeota archaeon]